MKTALFLFLMAAPGIAFAQTSSKWLRKVSQHLSYGVHESSLLSRCEVTVAPSGDKPGVLVGIQKTRMFPLDNIDVASIWLYDQDTLTGSTQYPGRPFESKNVLSIGYREKAEIGQFDKAVIIENLGDGKVSVKIEVNQNGKVTSNSCVVNSKGF